MMEKKFRVKPKILCGPGKTQQHYANEVNINRIMDRVKRVGVQALPMSQRKELYGDFSDVGDFYLCQKKILQAQANFDALPAKIRAYFQNDPGQLISFLNIEGNYDKAVEMGLVVSKEEPLKVGDPLPVREESRSQS